MKELTEAEKGWIAGIFEADGHFALRIVDEKVHSRRIDVAQHEDRIDMLQILKGLIGGKMSCKVRNMYWWRVCRKREIFRILSIILPYMKVKQKRKQATALLNESSINTNCDWHIARNKKPKYKPKESELRQLYTIKKLSINEVVKELNTTFSIVREHLIKYNIPIRSRSEAIKIKKRGL